MLHNNLNKKGAIELSIGTIVIIVLAMTMLILGLVLVTNIMKGGINLADVTNEKVKAQIVSLFTEEQSNVVIQTGADKIAEVKAGQTQNVNLGARLKAGGALNSRTDMHYTLDADQSSNGNCWKVDNGATVKKFFSHNLGDPIEFDRSDGESLFATIEVSVPAGTPSCTQKVFVTVKDTSGILQGSDYFIVKVSQGSIFG